MYELHNFLIYEYYTKCSDQNYFKPILSCNLITKQSNLIKYKYLNIHFV